MEYVAGRTLAESIDASGGCPLAEVLKYAVQIADALGCRARRGHRPPGPEAGQHHGDREGAGEGARLRPGQADRGGAGDQRDGDHRDGPAADRGGRDRGHGGLHVAGAGRGQEGGRAVGHLLVRRRAVRDGDGPPALSSGDTCPSTMAAILAREPAPPSSLVGELPFELERAILRCLRKEPERRWQTMADLTVALRDLKDELDSGSVSAVAVAPARRLRRRGGCSRPRWGWWCWLRRPQSAGGSGVRGRRRRATRWSA